MPRCGYLFGVFTLPSLATYRQFAAPETGRYLTGTVDGSGNSTTTAVCAALVSSISSDNLYADWWLYLPSASAGDKVRVVSSFAASTGTLTVDRAYSGASVPNSKTFEMHGACRPFADTLTEAVDWTSAINEALRHCFIEVEVTLSPVANAVRHDVTTANTWLTNPEWIRQVGLLTASETRANVDPYTGGRAVRCGAEQLSNLVYLTHPGRTFNTSDTLYLKCIKPAYFHCRAANGTFGDQPGLSAETDEAVPIVEWVGYGALVELARKWGMNTQGEDSMRADEDRWRQMFAYYGRRESASLPPKMLRPYAGINTTHSHYGRWWV